VARLLAACIERGIACLVLGHGALGRHDVDAVIAIAADESWAQTRHFLNVLLPSSSPILFKRRRRR
jgi:hypothetical protein